MFESGVVKSVVRFTSSLVLVLLVGMVGIFAGGGVSHAAADQGPWVWPAVDLSATGRDADSPRVASGADGTTTVVWQRSNGTNTVIQGASRAPGGSFGLVANLSEAGQNAFAPQVSVGPDGTTTVVWYRHDGSNWRVQAVTKAPGGIFGPAVDLSEAGQQANNPQVATGPDGTTTAVWYRSDGSNWRVQAATRPPGGSFGPAVDLSEAGQNATNPQVSVGPDGGTTVTWVRDDGSNSRVQATTRPAGGSFGPAVDLSASGQDAAEPQVSTGPDGTATVVWRRSDGSNTIIQTASRPSGGDFGSRISLSAPGQNAFGPEVSAGAGGVTVVWSRNDGTNRIVQVTSRPTDGPFGQAADLSEPGQDAFDPKVSSGPGGIVNATWRRSDGSNWIVQVATRTSGGSFGSATNLSVTGQHAYGPQVGTGPDGTATVAWSRSDGSNSIIQAASTEQRSYRLAVTKDGAGNGTVKSTPAGIDCGASCSSFFDVGSKITLTATPAAGSEFGGWDGVCAAAGKALACQVTMDQVKQASAKFEKATQSPLSVTKQGAGSGTVSSTPAGIDCGSACQASFDIGAKVTLMAAPAKGSMFTGWSGACSGSAVSCVVTMDQAKSVTASFAPQPTDSTSVFDGKYLYVRLKCAARFKPGCKGSAQAVTKKRKGKAMSSKASAAQKAGKWKIVKLAVKPSFKAKVAAMGKQPTKKLLVVKSVVSAKKYKRGKKFTVFHTYKVRTAG